MADTSQPSIRQTTIKECAGVARQYAKDWKGSPRNSGNVAEEIAKLIDGLLEVQR